MLFHMCLDASMRVCVENSNRRLCLKSDVILNCELREAILEAT